MCGTPYDQMCGTFHTFTVYDRIFDEIPAENTAYTPYINVHVWFQHVWVELCTFWAGQDHNYIYSHSACLCALQ
jgi:hypothetical protein